MTDSVPTAVLLRAHTAIEAQVVLALLRAEGITAFVNGAALVDEFAVSQRMLGLQGVEIQVRNEDLERARRLVDEAKREGRQAGDEAVAAAPDAIAESVSPLAARGGGGTRLLAFAGWALAIGLALMWFETKRQLDLSLASRSHGPWRTEMQPDGWISVWKDTNQVSSEFHDANHNGIPETATHFVRAGWKRSVAYDADENGLPERTDEYSAKGRLVGTWVDTDADGVFETKTIPHPDGSTSVYTDSDQDGQSERYERHAPDGRLVLEEEDTDENGAWEVQTAHDPDGSTCVSRDLDQDGVLDRRELHDATGKLVLVQVNHGLQGFVDEKP